MDDVTGHPGTRHQCGDTETCVAYIRALIRTGRMPRDAPDPTDDQCCACYFGSPDECKVETAP